MFYLSNLITKLVFKEKYATCGKYITKIVAPEGTVIELREY